MNRFDQASVKASIVIAPHAGHSAISFVLRACPRRGERESGGM